MSTVEPGRRVALLARPGAARDCVRGALLEVGADVVAEEDPVSADPEAVRAASPHVLMIVLDAGSEDALGRFDGVIGDPSIEVMFEEADVAVSREGWEAARWRRHLAAKLRHREGVLPPVSPATAGTPAPDSLSMQIEELMAAEDVGDEPMPTVELPETAFAGEDFSVFDPIAAEGGDAGQDFVLTVEGLELDASAFDPADEIALPPARDQEFSASDFDPLLAELDAEMPEPPPLPPALPEWHGDRFEDVRSSVESEPPAPDFVSPVPPPIDPQAPVSGFGKLSLADDASAPSGGTRGGAFSHNLDELERRISSLQLVDDAPAAPADPFVVEAGPAPIAPAAASVGAVLVMAGLGGPDAVRQFLGALPTGFGRPVLVRQRLDGARYDKLVAQMQRATQLPVVLADPGQSVAAGTVYVVGDDVGLIAEPALRFVAGAADRIVDTLSAGQSAVVMLSGGDVADAERIAALAAQGLWMGAQTEDGCYDPAAANALVAHGALAAAPAELARQLAQRWGS